MSTILGTELYMVHTVPSGLNVFHFFLSVELYVAFEEDSTSVLEDAAVVHLCVSANTSLSDVLVEVTVISSNGSAISKYM